MIKNISMFVILFFFTALAVSSQDYKKYERPSNNEYFLKISFSDGQTIMTMYGEQGNQTLVFNQRDVVRSNDTALIKGIPVLCREGFIFPEGIQSTDNIGKVRVETDGDGKTEIYFLKRASSSKYSRLRSENEIGLQRDISIDPRRFIRGSAVSFWSDIEISGEVNANVIAIFGDVSVNDEAVIRGDVLAIDGKVYHAKKSTIYGTIQDSEVKDRRRSFKLWHLHRNRVNFSTIEKFHYNRIDGAAPYFGFQFLRDDSTVPEINVYAGYAFASERWRYHIGLTQFFLANHSLSLNGAMYKRLASYDDWIVSENENTLFALLVTEDFKDYYEAEGGQVSAKYQAPLNIGLELGYRIEKQKWLEAHSGLWSLMGGSKRFRPNFSSVDKSVRTAALPLIEADEMSSLIAHIEYNPDGSDDYPDRPFFSASGDFEWTPSNWNDSLDFSRYQLGAYWYQPVNRSTSLLFHGVYGTIDGNVIPLNRMFFLGGLGILRGYGYKEYFGSKFWYGDIEYKIDITRSDWNIWLYCESGQVAKPHEDMDDAEVKNSIGIGFGYDDIIRFDISKRLDRTEDSATLYIRLKSQF